MESLLKVESLRVSFRTKRGDIDVIRNINFNVAPGKTLGIVGESGSGKSVTSLAVMGLLPATAKISSGRILFDGRDLLQLNEREMRSLRGGQMAMIFQDPMSSLNPSFTVGYQIKEVLKYHGAGEGHLDELAMDLLHQVGINDPALRLKAYPHELSGGMSQRVMIAMAIACSPKLLIADEPTTALDVTIQAQILDLLKSLQAKRKMGLILITHDIGVVAKMADSILVMYAGVPMEMGPTKEVIQNPRHPYTKALLGALPGRHHDAEFRSRLMTIPGMVPDLLQRPSGCHLNPRCSLADESCRQREPEPAEVDGVKVKCSKVI